MADASNALSALEIMGEIWDSFSGWEKASTIIVGAFMLLGAISSIEENTPNNPEDIPTAGQINDKQEEIRRLEERLKDTASGTLSGSDADSWEAMTRQALKEIEQYRHQMFAPGAVTEIREALESAEKFQAEEMNAAAGTTLYQAWQLARTTKKKVLEGEKTWEETAVIYLSCHGNLQTVLNGAAEMPVEFTTDRGRETLIMDADFWSGGQVSALQKDLPEEELSRSLTVEQVQQQIQQLRDAANTLRQVITDAVDAFRSSQQRMELCDAVYGSFLNRGWMLDEEGENGFEQQDPRKDACLSLYSAARDRLEFTFSGAGHIALKTRFKNVHNQGLNTYLEGILRQVLTENGFTVTELTSSI